MSAPKRHPLGRRCGDPRVVLFVLVAMPYALARLAWDSRPHKGRPPSKPARKPINTKPIRLAEHAFDVLPALLLLALATGVPHLNIQI